MAELRDEPESWPVHESEDVWSGKGPFSVVSDLISVPSSPEERFSRLVVQHPGACIVLAVDDRERALVLRQYRHPARLRFVELPAGLFDVEGEDPQDAAARELLEEAQLVAQRWTHLLTSYPSPGISSERMEIYLAEDVREAADRGGFEPAHEEADMTTEWVPVSELVDAALGRRLTDGPLVAAVLAYVLHRQRAAEG